MDRKNEKALRTLADKELSTVAGGSWQDFSFSPVTITVPQQNLSTITQVVAGNFGSGPNTLTAAVVQGNSSNIS